MNKFLTYPFLIRVGLACVFLANSLMAFLEPDEFNELVSGSFLAGLLPISVAAFVTFIGFSDGIMALLLFSGWQTAKVAIYATCWLIGVTIIVGVFSLEGLEHLCFIAMAVALLVDQKST